MWHTSKCKVAHSTFKYPFLVAVHKQPCFVCINFVFINQCCLESWGDPIRHSCLLWMRSEPLDLQMDANASGVSRLGNWRRISDASHRQRFIGGSQLSRGQASLPPFLLSVCVTCKLPPQDLIELPGDLPFMYSDCYAALNSSLNCFQHGGRLVKTSLLSGKHPSTFDPETSHAG